MKMDMPPKENGEEKNILNLEEYFSGKRSFNDLIELSFNVSVEEQDVLLKQWVNLVEKYPKQADDFMELFAQNPFGTPEVFLDSVFSIITKPGVSNSVVSLILGEINTQFWYRPDEMKKVTMNYLDFNDYKNIAKTGAFLEYLTFFIEQSDMEDSFYTETVKSFEDILTKKTKEQKGSYLLNMRAEQLIEKRTYRPNIEYAPFEITKGIYALIRNKQMFLADESDYNKINEIINTIQNARDSGNPNLVQKASRFVGDLNEFFKKPVFDKLFLSNKPENGDVNDFAYLEKRSTRDLIKKEFGVSLSELSIPEQFQVLQFLKYQDCSSVKDVQSFSRIFGVSGFKSFLSIEQGGKEMGDKILKLGNPDILPKEIAEKIFKKYGEIINTADNTEEEIKKIFGNKDISNKVLISVKETLLKRGQKMLSDLGDKVLDPKFKVNETEILNELEDIKSETIILGESYVKFYKEGIKVPIEDVTQIEQISTQDLTEDEKKEFLKVYENGRPKVTYENKEHLELLKEEFKQELENKDTLVFNIRFNGDIIIFAIVDKKDNDTLYIGGLTFTDEVRTPVIAEASMNCVLDKFKNYNIRALVDSRNPILSMYQKRFGFKIVGELPREENAGELYYEIEKSKSETDKIMGIKEEIEKAA